MTDDDQLTEDPTKASKPIEEPPAEGEVIEAFSLTISIRKGNGFQISWTIGNPAAQAFFFKHHPIAAAMLGSLVQPQPGPPVAQGPPPIDPEKRIGELGPRGGDEALADLVEETLLKDPRFRKPSSG